MKRHRDFICILTQEAAKCVSAPKKNSSVDYFGNSFVSHLLMAAILSAIAFTVNSRILYSDYDGMNTRIDIKQYYDWGNNIFSQPNSPIFGLGNTQNCCFDYRWFPSDIIGAYTFNHGEINSILSYWIIAMELFAAIFFLCRQLEIKQNISLCCAWLCIILSLPWTENNAVSNFAFGVIMPNYVEAIAIQAFIIGSWISLGRGAIPSQWKKALVTAGLIIWLFLAIPLFCITNIPSLGVIMLFLLTCVKTRREFLIKTLFSIILAITIALLFGARLLGNLLYSVPSFFSHDLEPDTQHFQQIMSFCTFGFLWSPALIGAIFFIFYRIWKKNYKNLIPHTACLAGVLLLAGSLVRIHYHIFDITPADIYMTGLFALFIFAVYSKNYPMRVARGILVCLAGIFLPGLFVALFIPHYEGIHPNYFEFSLWCFYIIFAVCGLYCLMRCLAKILPSYITNRMARPIVLTLNFCCREIAWFGMVLGILAIIESISAANISCRLPNDSNRCSDVRMLDRLQNLASLKPKGIFRGSVASFYGIRKYNSADIAYDPAKDHSYDINSPGILWMDQCSNDEDLASTLGTDLRSVGLWKRSIPTLFEYSQLFTPSFYAVCTRLLARPQDKTKRNIIVLSYPRIKYLESLGVRFIITDFDMDELGEPLETLNLPNFPTYKLYELPDPNLGTYTPTQYVLASTADACIRYMSSDSFPFRREVVLQEPINEKLVPATSTVLRWGASGLRVEVNTPGPTLILLPLQYTHCLSLVQLDAVSSKNFSSKVRPRLVRANLTQVALFMPASGTIEISFSNWIFGIRNGRIMDAADMKKLQLAKLPSAAAFPPFHL